MTHPLRITILGLSITSSWGNGHATTFRALVRGLAAGGHSVLFLERDVPWYRSSRDLPEPPYCTTHLYGDLDELFTVYAEDVRSSDLVIVGSYVPEGVAIGNWVCATCRGITAFYDIDTPVTLCKLARGDYEYIDPKLVGQYDCYLSFTGGPILGTIRRIWDSPLARALYCSVDAELYCPQDVEPVDDLGYLGTYSEDRQPPLEHLMLDAARQWPEGRFVVAGPRYPEDVEWLANVRRIEHLPPHEHCEFYGSQRFTMNLTRAEMIRTGYAPSVRLFEAAACGTPIISDWWEGLDSFFQPGQEILISRCFSETLRYLQSLNEDQRLSLGHSARQRVLADHTCERRARELEQVFEEAARSKQKLWQNPGRPTSMVAGR